MNYNLAKIAQLVIILLSFILMVWSVVSIATGNRTVICYVTFAFTFIQVGITAYMYKSASCVVD